MRTTLAISLLAVLLCPAAVWADRDDDREEWRERQEEWRERQEERAEEARERYEKQRKEWSKHQEKMREHERKQWQKRGYYAPPPPRDPYNPYRYGYQPAPNPPRFDGYGRPYPYRQHRHHSDDDDDIDAIYTPWGYYEDYPRTPYDARRPRPEGRGQIGPFRFEVWK